MTSQLPTIAEAKAQARRLRERLNAEGSEISHGKSLELVAHQHGFRDWNTFHAAIGNRPPAGFTPGGRVRGHYLSQPFEATVLSVEMPRPGWFRLELDLDTPVDVVTFDSFSNFRKRIRGTVGPSGVSRERTADGRPHLEIEI
ncbi:MAG: glyoxalase superfamily protein [Paracoccaceae bacterium]